MLRAITYIGTVLALAYLIIGLLIWCGQHYGQPVELIWSSFPTPGWVHVILAILGLIGMPYARRVLAAHERHVLREKGPTCLSCGYSLIGNVSGTCPECGCTAEDSSGVCLPASGPGLENESIDD